MINRLSGASATLIALCGILAPLTADAFCGAYVSQDETAPKNKASEIILAQSQGVTTLTMNNDFEGAADDFALIIPVPAVLGPESVSVVNPSAFNLISNWSQPRLVRYSCDDIMTTTQVNGLNSSIGCVLGGCSADNSFLSAEDGATDYGVTVEAEFEASEYEIVVLSAEESNGLFGWLEAEGFKLPPGSSAMFEEYIESGSYFLAARINIDAVPEGQEFLSPLQLRYESAQAALPIRMGTVSSAGRQELVVHHVNPVNEGEAAISNYPEITIEDECMWKNDEDESFADFYDRLVEEQEEAAGGAAWMTEYSWPVRIIPPPSFMGCDPCPPGIDPHSSSPTTTPTVQNGIGVDLGPLGMVGDAHVTRIRMRYRPDQIHEDLLFYTTGEVDRTEQIRFIEYNEQLEFSLPVCGEGFVEEPGECPQVRSAACSVPGGPTGGPALLAILIAFARRRRS